ncbi:MULTISPECIES: FdhF/YdeP family oxidoreductase [unclassified Mucilaginibacter]|uniref:FdhF/YdeP family oxidoreductase n=1 Tax=unclassified Mucilaginibacter TaxID=2617802 RepID=UPI002AC8C05B|nr:MULTISPECIES: FdhF/YdeP family oxidoreductase [unclassified Mucilaginibacter]MEB0262694.1 FdhF/YdeP family oxidoreductase [Mucilaginibacter sp. 10I4]MEB0279468.1 FdhF/YdeP family oxidoreductase [Mucilaginibacter sp. 10B2]MEB0300029.1 FdhF/YdeP family oxidoreductase [Mucilaginibacter sp. 5C4]WPX21842.1 FdhF/YdeP family oxidoreductase [Mucilaginibacter sp. 5C4]
MSKETKEQPAAENPETLHKLTVSQPKKWAAGIPAVVASFADILEETGAIRGPLALFKMNQKGGFDCSSCAWPDPDDDRSPIAEYCENGAKALADEATTKKLTPDFFAQNSVADLSKLDDMTIGKNGRIAQPMYLPKGATHYQPISWYDAFHKIGDKLNSLASPNEAAFYTSGRTSNEASFVYQLFVREFGTNNMPDCSNMCHESTSVALAEVIGIGKATVTLNDLYDSEVIIIMGQNPGTNHPRMLTGLEKAKKNGSKIIAINPLHEAGLMGFKNPQSLTGIMGVTTQLADVYLQVQINGDMALLKALEKLLYDAEQQEPGKVFDREFIGKSTVGYDEFIEGVKDFDVEALCATAGVPFDQVKEAAELLKHKSKIIICWAMGITQQKNGVDTVKEIVNLTLLKGSIGKAGAGLCPVRGHSNVQGNRTMMIWDKPKKEQLAKLKEIYGFTPPQEHGYDVVDSIKAMQEGKLKVFFAMGGNFLSATPDTTFTAEAMRKLELSVHVSTKLNRSHLVHGEEAIILPTLARSDKDVINGEDQFISCENSMGVVQMSKGILDPVSKELLNEMQIVCELAKATLKNRTVIDWGRFANSYDAIRDDIGKVIPGFENYNQRVRLPGGFYLPNAAREGKFETETFKDKAPFTVTQLPDHVMADDEYMMTTIRSHDQFNTTIYGMEDRYRGIHNERRVIFMNPKDIAKAGFMQGDKVDLFNYYDDIERVARLFIIVPYNIPERNTATYYPEGNVLVPINSVALKSNCPTSKLVFIKIRKHEGISNLSS